MSMIELIKPMLLARGDIPFDNSDYIFEFKFDGVRMLAYKFDGQVRLFNRKQNERTMQYPEVVASLGGLSEGVVLDGEVIAVNASGRQDFYGLLRRDLATKYKSVPDLDIFYIVFDILYFNGQSVKNEPIESRKSLLRGVLDSDRDVIRQIDYFRQSGKMMFELAKQEGLEGIVAKRLGSVYEENKRNLNWIKIKTNTLIR